ncbi:DNA repair and recombination protein [Venturia nashicola]|uniref:DNA repair and recombination protein n=1 Tax=Venturia nashicola TaxID=86259 RepID=A0A4Z1NTZ5_9PEZI|nr:DNA repair and recombination protein [Venturia nashicola]TLD20233.1 DNA repair and recombination protein [Venturia nashicola]
MRSSSYFAALLAATAIAAPIEENPSAHSNSKRQFTLFGVEFDKRIQWSTLMSKPSLISTVLPLLKAKYNKQEGHFIGTAEALPAFQGFVELMGANKTHAGGFPDWYMEVFKGTPYGRTDPPPEAAAIPRRQELKSETNVPGAKAVKIRYGPYKVPSAKVMMHNQRYGMLENYPELDFEKPCTGDCTIIGMRQGLEYPDGRDANVDNGLWLHHSVILAVGEGREDTTCLDQPFSLPHITANTTHFQSERIFSTGNERTDAVFPDMGVNDAGYKIRDQDKLALLLELMNENGKDETVYFTMVWDILDGHPLPHDVQLIHHDIRNCGTSEVNPPEAKSKFTLNTTWVSTIDAEVMGILGHIHDGGLESTIHVDGKLACNSEAMYGGAPGYISKGMGDMPGMENMAGMTMKHISKITPCGQSKGLDVREIKKGQKLTLAANYDFEKWPGMKEPDGSWDQVMGLTVMYVKKPVKSATTPPLQPAQSKSSSWTSWLFGEPRRL